MEAYKRGGNTVWDWKYHLVWETKYRYCLVAIVGFAAANCCARRRGRMRWS
jgi:REP element-mobilizing transposase RayT